MPIQYLKGDATNPQTEGPKIIAHLCNDQGGFGKGFVLALSKRWKGPEKHYRRWYASKMGFELGAIQVVEVMDNLWVANMVAQRGYRTRQNSTPLQYPALKTCLESLALEANARKASIHMPRIGTGLGGSRWEIIEPLIQAALGDCSVFVYDYDR